MASGEWWSSEPHRYFLRAIRKSAGITTTAGGERPSWTVKSPLMLLRSVVPFRTGLIGRREYGVIDRASFSNKPSPLELGFWNKSNDFTHVRLQTK